MQTSTRMYILGTFLEIITEMGKADGVSVLNSLRES